MGIYYVTDCISGVTFNVDFGSYEVNPNDVWSFSGIDEILYCGIINNISESTETTYSAITQYVDCYDCFTGSGISILLEECNGLFVYSEPATSFSTIPTLDDVYNFCSPSDPNECYCFKVLGLNTYIPPFEAVYVGGPFVNCFSCLNPPKSANTETFLCQEICTWGGTTTISITPPHPVWTDGYGTAVTQLNMITLGGPDGLNN